MVEQAKTVPVVVQWKENGTVQKRTLQVTKGYGINSNKSGTHIFAKANQVVTLDKADAYLLLGTSHANPDKDAKYKFDQNDMTVLHEEWYNSRSNVHGQLRTNTVVRSGSGAGKIGGVFFNTHGEYVIEHGNGDRLSIFNSNKK